MTADKDIAPSKAIPAKKPLPAAAERALAEAAARRAAQQQPDRPKELGRTGLDPARYGDWEVKGLATDF